MYWETVDLFFFKKKALSRDMKFNFLPTCRREDDPDAVGFKRATLLCTLDFRTQTGPTRAPFFLLLAEELLKSEEKGVGGVL